VKTKLGRTVAKNFYWSDFCWRAIFFTTVAVIIINTWVIISNFLAACCSFASYSCFPTAALLTVMPRLLSTWKMLTIWTYNITIQIGADNNNRKIWNVGLTKVALCSCPFSFRFGGNLNACASAGYRPISYINIQKSNVIETVITEKGFEMSVKEAPFFIDFQLIFLFL
jgi:hypothetical protein